MEGSNAIDANDANRALAGLERSRSGEVNRLIQAARTEKSPEGDDRAGAAFEKYFSTMLVKELRKSLPSGLFDGAGSDIYTSWFDEHLGEALSSRDALGISGLIKTSLARMNAAQEAGLDAASLALDAETHKEETL